MADRTERKWQDPYEALYVLPHAPHELVVEIYWHLVEDLQHRVKDDPRVRARLRELNEAYAAIVGGEAAPPEAPAREETEEKGRGLFRRREKKPDQRSPWQVLHLRPGAPLGVVDLAHAYWYRRLHARFDEEGQTEFERMEAAFRRLRGDEKAGAPSPEPERRKKRAAPAIGRGLKNLGSKIGSLLEQPAPEPEPLDPAEARQRAERLSALGAARVEANPPAEQEDALDAAVGDPAEPAPAEAAADEDGRAVAADDAPAADPEPAPAGETLASAEESVAAPDRHALEAVAESQEDEPAVAQQDEEPLLAQQDKPEAPPEEPVAEPPPPVEQPEQEPPDERIPPHLLAGHPQEAETPPSVESDEPVAIGRSESGWGRLIARSGVPRSFGPALLGPVPFTIGTDPNSNLVLPDIADEPVVVARIWLQDGRFMFHGLSDDPPVLVNGHPMSWAVLEHGDEISIADAVLRFEIHARREAS